METTPIRVAYVNDHEFVVEAMRILFADQADFEMIIGSINGMGFLDELEKAKVKPDLCLLDISMPGMTGFELLAKITDKYPGQKCMMFSMHSEPENILMSIIYNARGYSVSNCAFSSLIKKIRDIVEGPGHSFPGEYSLEMLHAITKNGQEKMKHLTIDFTPKEREFLILTCKPLTYVQIAYSMNIEYSEVKNIIAGLVKKLNLHTREEFMQFSFIMGYMPLPSLNGTPIYKALPYHPPARL